MFYISKIDEEHGDFYAVLSALKEKHGAAICPVMIPLSDGTGVIDLVPQHRLPDQGRQDRKGRYPCCRRRQGRRDAHGAYGGSCRYRRAYGKSSSTPWSLPTKRSLIGLKGRPCRRSVVPVVCGAAWQTSAPRGCPAGSLRLRSGSGG